MFYLVNKMIKFIKIFIWIFLIPFIIYISVFVFYSNKRDECSALWKSNAISECVVCYESIPFFIDPSVKIELFELHVDKRFGISNPVKGMSYISSFSLDKKKEIVKSALMYSYLDSDVRDFLNNYLENKKEINGFISLNSLKSLN